MNSTLKLLKAHFDRYDWNYEEGDNGFLYIGLEGHFMHLYGSDEVLCVDVYFHLKGLVEHWPHVTAYVEQANRRMVLGNLRTDSNAGIIWFHHGIGFPEGELTESLIKEMVVHTVISCKLFVDELDELVSTASPVHVQNQFSGGELI